MEQQKNNKGFKVNNSKQQVRYQIMRNNNKKHADKETQTGDSGGVEVKNIFEKLYDLTVPVDLNEPKTQHNIDDLSTVVTEEAEKVQTNESDSELSVYAILESHVEISRLSHVCSKVFKGWDWTSNASYCNKGCRIILGWKTDVVNVVLIAQTDQAMHIKIFHKAANTIIYDFHVALNLEDSLSCSSSFNSAMNDFKECVNKIEILDIKSSGLHFTWNQKPKNRSGLLKKLDHIMCNLDFVDCFQGAYGMFQPYRLFDHSPAVIKIPTLMSAEAAKLQAFMEAKLDKERFLKQKAKIDWLEAGDSNSTFFHKSIKSKNQKSRIEVILDANNVEITGPMVVESFVSHYKQFLRTNMTCDDLDSEDLFVKKISDGTKTIWCVRCIMRRLNPPCLILVTIVLRVQTVSLRCSSKRVGALWEKICVVLSKISSIMVNCLKRLITPFLLSFRRIIDALKEVISHNQSAFVPAFVTSASYSICINGEVHGYFNGMRGLRQGDPLSPYLFTLVMEILTLIIKRRIHRNSVKNVILNIMPFNEDKPDACCWRGANGVTSLFLVSKVWEAIRPRDHEEA
nr:hypothetical protein [Tanacetum cinerariifolium]